jgi:hypothetical protein
MNKDFFMNFAEGKDVPAVKYDGEETAKDVAKELADKLNVDVFTLKVVARAYPKDITCRVKTYEDACEVIGISPVDENELKRLEFTEDEIAYRKLKTIARALNGDWEPDWTDRDEYKYWPWFYTYYSMEESFVYANTNSKVSNMNAAIGSRLCFKTRELAKYAGEQFVDIYRDFLLIKKNSVVK